MALGTPSRYRVMAPLSKAESPLPLPARFSQIKNDLIRGRHAEVQASWSRLLIALRDEIDEIAATGSSVIPSIDYSDLNNRALMDEFTAQLRRRGAAVIRAVVDPEDARQWKIDAKAYLADITSSLGSPASRDHHLHAVYWSPAQIKGRVHPSVLATQRLLMNSLWHNNSEPARNSNGISAYLGRSSSDSTLLSTNYPISYADRLRIRIPGDAAFYRNAHVDGGSVERWEPDGYGLANTYARIWEGRWEEYDPWDSGARLKVTSDLYNGTGTCSTFRMFQGWLSLSDIPPDDGTLLLCPSIKLSTAYFLLRPFFSPIHDCPSHADYLLPSNWVLDDPPTSIIHGARPSYTQELNDILHPHLDLSRSLVQVPRLSPGDYVVWHCDAVYAIDGYQRDELDGATVMYIPACPLTQTNALYLARQRKAFLLGQPSPDFGAGRGESTHLSRPGVQEVHAAGGEDGLKAMGLMPWEEDEAVTESEAEVVEMANRILFPDRYEMP
ncbi:hypothetical protein NLU13_8168 [Sarocladium strictum]|uniref:DUF1479-domain-containing protein n=1 Tax=Sarocladium strictum TaxID=5046 RepID=A0AA39L4Y3_SARSR|nr:hypothetical protein NLU13_8168 [Sarocladium strictum]